MKQTPKKYAYGLFSNISGEDEHYWHYGICLTEKEAKEAFENILNDELFGKYHFIGKIEIL